MAILLTVVIALSSYRVAALIGYVRWGVRGGFLALIGGLIAYSYIALGMPGSQGLLNNLGAWGIVLTTSFGCVLGIGAAWAWRAVRVSIRPGAADR